MDYSKYKWNNNIGEDGYYLDCRERQQYIAQIKYDLKVVVPYISARVEEALAWEDHMPE